LKKIIYIFLFSLVCCPWMKAQVNLVPNPGFEDTLMCDHSTNQFQGYVDKWYGLNVQYFEYYCGGDSGAVGLPVNEWGIQWQRNGGAAYAGLAPIYLDSFAYTKNLRNYIYVPLTDTLQHGKQYFVSFYVSLSNYVIYACNDFGAKFTTTQPILDGTLMSSPQIKNDPVLNPLTDTLNWMEIKGRFIAAGGEKYLILGNFVSDSLSHIQYMHEAPNPTSYDWRESFYYIDDVFVGLDTLGTMGITPLQTVQATVKLYPNPNNGTMQISYELGTHQEAVFEIYDVCGKLLRTYAMDPDRDLLAISEAVLSQGIYFYKVRAAEAVLSSGKFVILK